MRAWLDFAEGPFFRFAFAIMVLGLLRLVIITVYRIIKTKEATPDKSTNIVAQIGVALYWLRRWIVPPKDMSATRPFYTAVSALFHIGILVVPILYLAHVTLWFTGFGWRPISYENSVINFSVAFDALTLLTIVTGVVLFVMRVSDQGSRKLSHMQDYLLTPLIVVIFLTGFMAAHPAQNPLGYITTRFIHVMAGNVLFVLMPFTKLAHVVLLPFTQAMWDVSWKFVPGVGQKVRAALGTQDKPI